MKLLFQISYSLGIGYRHEGAKDPGQTGKGSLDFSKRIKKGEYIFILDAVDLLTGSSRLYQAVRLF